MLAMASSGGKQEREPGLYVKQGSKFHSKMLSKEAAAQLAAPSFRVYYSVASAGAVPFLWESEPGTPKNDSPSAAALPPLTPPPSYSYYAAGGGRGGRYRKRRHGLLGALLLRRPGRAAAPTFSSGSWSSSSSSASTMSPVFTVHSSPAGARHRHRRTLSAGNSDDDAAHAAPRCFGVERHCCERGLVRVRGVAAAVRNALATVVGGRRATTSAAAA